MPGLCRPQVQLMSLSRSRAERRSCRGCAGRLQFGRGKATGRPVPIGRECPVLWIADAKADVAKSTRPEADLAPMLPEARCGLENKFVEHVVLAVRRSTGCRRSHFGCGWSSQLDWIFRTVAITISQRFLATNGLPIHLPLPARPPHPLP